MDKSYVKQEIGYIGARLREKSTYAGLGVVLGVLLGIYKGHINIDPTALAGALESIGIGVGAMIAIFMPENGAKAVIAALIVGLCVLFGSPDALAGDVNAPVIAAINKAAPKASYAPCVVGTTATPTSCSGLYVGAGIAGNGTNANIIGNGINGSVFAAGAMPYLSGGYQYVQGNWTFGVDLKGGYQTSTQSTLNGVASNSNGARFIEMFRAGGNVASLLGNQTPISIPPLLQNSLLTLYAEVGSAQHQLVKSWANGTASGAGALFDVGPHSFLDLEYVNIQYNAAQTAGQTLSSENLLLLSYKYKF